MCPVETLTATFQKNNNSAFKLSFFDASRLIYWRVAQLVRAPDC